MNALYLGDGLGLNLLLADAAAQQITQESYPPYCGTKKIADGEDRAAKELHWGAGGGEPSTNTTWQPTASVGCAKARKTAGEK